MLLLTRSVGDKLTIGENITLTVLGFHGNQIRIGIDAPRDVQIDRAEWPARERSDSNVEYLQACG
ncbi:MAG: carbon storage regulator [Lysobacterales bacterium]